MTELRNRYFLMRHGQSQANAAKVIVSSLARDSDGDYGLTALGRDQAAAAGATSGLPPGTVIVSSGFTRARETAEIVRQSLQAPPVTVADALQILQAGFLRLNPRLHRGVKHLRTAEIRPVTLARALAAVVPRVPIPLTGPARGR